MKYWYILLLFMTSSLFAEPYETKVIRAIESLRTIHDTEDKDKIAQFNEIMDSNWKTFSEKKSDSLPIIESKLKEEIISPTPSQMILLDLSWYLVLSDPKPDLQLISKAFETIDFRNAAIIQNSQQFFRLAFYLGQKQIPGFLQSVDQRFLRNDNRSFFIPKHIAIVDAHAQRTHLYGIYGNESIKHLLNILKTEKEPKLKRDITSILRRICTPDCAQEISVMLEKETDHTTFVNGTYILLDNSGPLGRELYLKLKPKSLSKETEDYFVSEQDYVRNQNYQFLVGKLKKKFGDSSNDISESKILSELDKAIENQGENRIHPLDYIFYRTDKQILIQKLIEARRKCFLRTNRHGMEDIDLYNFILNTIYFQEVATDGTI